MEGIKMFVLIKCDTSRVGCDCESVYEFPDDTTEDQLQEYATDCAKDNAEMYGIIEDAEEEAEESGIEFVEDEHYSGSFEILNKSRDEIIEEYGEINKI